jgi:hypothetical protein
MSLTILITNNIVTQTWIQEFLPGGGAPCQKQIPPYFFFSPQLVKPKKKIEKKKAKFSNSYFVGGIRTMLGVQGL